MHKYGVIPFRFGPATPSVLTGNEKQFYDYVVKLIDPSLVNIRQEILTVTVSLTEVADNEYISYSKIAAYASSWITQVDLVVIDIRDPREIILPGRTEVHIASAINSLQASAKSVAKNTRFIVLMPELPPIGEPFRIGVQAALDAGELIVIADNGNILGSSVFLNNLDANQYQFQRLQTLDDPLKLLGLKMIRRLGHFKREAGSDSKYNCVRYFFDGSKCDNELVLLFEDYLARNKEDMGQYPTVFYHCTVSTWLMDSVGAFASKNQLEHYDLNLFLQKRNEVKVVNPVIILPLVDSGKTLETLLHKWINDFNLPRPKILAILTTTATDITNRIRKLRAVGQDFDIDFFMKVERTKPKVEVGCPLCSLNIPFSKYEIEDFAMLTTFDMWDMVEDAGWKSEDNVPRHRIMLDIVPRFPEMLRKHGAWVAQKILYRLAYELKKFPAQPILVVCPDEDGVGTLTGYLSVIHNNVTVLKIPKSIIELCGAGTVKFDQLEGFSSENNAWCQQLKAAAPSQPVVVMEEFCVTGGTAKALVNLVRSFGREIDCHFSIVNFNISISGKFNIPFYSLYEFHIEHDHICENEVYL